MVLGESWLEARHWRARAPQGRGTEASDDGEPPSSPSGASSPPNSVQGSEVVEVPAAELPEWLQEGAHVSKVLADGEHVDGVVGPFVGAEGRVIDEGGSRIFCWEDDVTLLKLSTVAELIESGEIERGSNPTPPLVEFVVRTEKRKPRLAGALLGTTNDVLFVPPQPAYLNFYPHLEEFSSGWRAPLEWAGGKYRTFRAGDIVQNEQRQRAAVARVLTFEYETSATKQWRNVLVLYEHEAEQPGFFIGGWSRWTRVETEAAQDAWDAYRAAKTAGDADAVTPPHDADPMADVCTLTMPQMEAMETALRQSAIRKLPLSTVVSQAKASEQTPPAAKAAAKSEAGRERQTEQHREAERARLDEAVAEAKAAEEAAWTAWVAADALLKAARAARAAACGEHADENGSDRGRGRDRSRERSRDGSRSRSRSWSRSRSRSRSRGRRRSDSYSY